MFRVFFAVFRKEVLHILRDRRLLVMATLVPALQLLVFGFLDTNVHDLPTIVVDQDHSSESRLLLEKVRATRTFAVRRVTASPEEARDEIIAGRARVGIVIPPDFHDKRARQELSEISVLLDGSDNVVSSQALAAVNGMTSDIATQEAAQDQVPRGGIAMEPMLLFNQEGRAASFLIPAMIAIILQFIGSMMTALSIVRERERGTLEQLLVAPINVVALMLGKVLPFVLVGLVQLTLVIVLMWVGFDVPVKGNLFLLYAICLVYIFGILALGLFISTRARTSAEAVQLATMILLPAVFLSGYFFPREGLPTPLYIVGEVLPATHMIAVLRGIVQRDAGLQQLWWDIMLLFVIAFVLMLISVRRFRKSVVD